MWNRRILNESISNKLFTLHLVFVKCANYATVFVVFFPVNFCIFCTHNFFFIHLLLLEKCNRNSSKTNKIMLIYSKPPLFSPTDSPMRCNNWTLDSFAYGRWFLSWSTKCTPWLMCLTWWKWSHCEGVFNQESFIPRNVWAFPHYKNM